MHEDGSGVITQQDAVPKDEYMAFQVTFKIPYKLGS